MKEKSYMIILIYSEIAFDKIQHTFLIKTLNKLGIEGMNILCEKPITNVTLNKESLKVFL